MLVGSQRETIWRESELLLVVQTEEEVLQEALGLVNDLDRLAALPVELNRVWLHRDHLR